MPAPVKDARGAFEQGQKAARRGASRDCTYKNADMVAAWLRGYDAAKHEKVLPCRQEKVDFAAC